MRYSCGGNPILPAGLRAPFARPGRPYVKARANGWRLFVLLSALSLVPLSTAASAATLTSAVPEAADQRREVVVLDAGIADWRTLADGVAPHADVIRVAADRDGLSALADALRGRRNIEAIHVISHGEPGAIRLGRTRIDRKTLRRRPGALRTIRSALAPDADILLAACDTASGAIGRSFLGELARATGADVAASTDATGSGVTGANWNLETRTGPVETRLALSGEARKQFRGRLVIDSQVTYSFETKYPSSDPCVVDQGRLNRSGCDGNLEPDSTTDVLFFNNWYWDEFDAPDVGVSIRDDLGAASTISDPNGDSFKFTSFHASTFCGATISFDLVGYENGSPTGDSKSYTLGVDATATYSPNFPSVDEVRFENFTQSGGFQCVVFDELVFNQAVSSNTQPAFANLDATVAFDEAAGTPVVIDGNATVSDAELDGANDYAGSSLTVQRTGGANGDDDFGFDTGAGTFSVSGGDLLTGGNVFASFTESGGTLTINFNSSQAAATSALVDDVLQGVTYAHAGDPVEVEYGMTLTFDDGDVGGALATSESLSVVVDPQLVPITVETTLDFTALSPELSDGQAVDARVVNELLFYGFGFGDAAENSAIASNELQLDQVTSDPGTTGTRFEADENFKLKTIDIDNFSSQSQDVTVHGYRNGTRVGGRTFSMTANSGYQTKQFVSVEAAFGAVDEVRLTANVDNGVAIDNIVIGKGNNAPVLDLDTGTPGSNAASTFDENGHQGATTGDGVTVTGTVSVADSDGTVDSATVTLDNPQGDTGEGLSVDTASLASALGFSTSANQITINRNTASEADLVAAIEAVRYQNDSDTPDTTARAVTVEVTDDQGDTASATATVTILAGNDTPTVTGPGGTLEPDEDIAFDLSGANAIQIADVDAGGATVEVSLSANNGTLTLGSTTGIVFDSGSNGSGAFTVAGTVTDLNNALATLDYQGNADYFGADTVSVTVNDRGNSGTDPGNTGDATSEAGSTAVSLDVQAVDDAPTITAIADQATDEDATITGIPFTIDDAETAASGLTVSFSAADPSLIAGHAFGGSGANRTLDIVPANDRNGTTMITVTVDDGGMTTQDSFQLTINSVNDLPTVSPAIATFDTTVNEDAAVPSVMFTVDDVESGGAGVAVTASSGNQVLVPDANLSVTDNGGGNRTLGVTLANDENGTANITVTLDDGMDTVDDSFTLTVNPQNDPPAVSLTPASDTIPEGNGGPVTVAQFSVDDDNEAGSTNDLSLTGPDAGDFGINGSDLDFRGSADFEAKDTYDVTVEVDDPGVGGTPDDAAAFTLGISDVDETPTFSATGPFPVSESDGNGTAVGDVDAVDGDSGNPDENLTYAIIGGNAGGAFAINGASGEITVADASAVDFDASPTFSLDVEADDGTNAPTVTVTINVSNAAPSIPGDSDGSRGGAVDEGAANGTAVGITADATDPGGGTVSYALTDDAGGRFQINAGTGTVTVADGSLIDYEGATSHSIGVQALDADGADSGTATFTVVVNNVDSPPAFTAIGPFSVGEAPSNGTAVGDVDANNGDAGAADAGIDYSITAGNTGGAFAIDNSGAITVVDGSQIDFETSGSFNLTVQADDGGSTASASVTVNVTDEPPAQPVETDGGADSVAEDAPNGTPVGVDVSSNDPAGGTVTYALTSDAGGRFAIDGAGGEVTVANTGLIDFESSASHTIDIEARDADGTASDVLSVTIAVTDAPDDPTVSAPPDLTGADAIDATGLYTRVDLEREGDASANDDDDGTLTPEPDVDNPAWLRPGTHEITWSATDSDGATVTAVQNVEIRPRVGIGPDRTVQEGTAIQIPIELNGDPIDGTTPTIDFALAGTGSAMSADYAGLGAPGSATMLAGSRTAVIGFDVLDDGMSGEGPETLVVELTGTGGNTALAERTRTTITIVEANTAPVVSLSAEQAGVDPAVEIDGTTASTVTVTAATVDATDTAAMTFAWNGGETGLTDLNNDANPATFEFNPANATPGVYEIAVTATDDGAPYGTPGESGRGTLRLRIVDPFPALGSVDTDGDGTNDDDPGEGREDRDGDGLPAYRDPYADANALHQAQGDPGGFLIEAEPGLDLGLGPVAFERDLAGTLLSADDIAAVRGARDELTNVGGYFGFTVGGLPTAGMSAAVVIPQREPIPEEAVYRKIGGAGGWRAFQTDGSNRLASAPGAKGYCPPPDAPIWRTGLGTGDWCVRLTIEDGGPNDADMVANGRITDPGGVARGSTVGEDGAAASSSGGGVFGALALWLLALGVGFVSATRRGLAGR